MQDCSDYELEQSFLLLVFNHLKITNKLNLQEDFSFKKNEKLKSRKLTELLFAKGKSFLVFPIKVVYLGVPPITDAQALPPSERLKVGVSVSNRKFKNAVDRNRIKRLLREYYRTTKHPLLQYAQGQNQQIAVFFMYIDKQLPPKGLIDKKMPIVLDKLINLLSENHQQTP